MSSNEMYDIYFDISNSLRKKEQELKEREKKDSAQIFGLLAKATSMSLVNSINEPYKAYIENFQTGQRSTIPDDFTIDDLASFESLLTVVTEPLLKARLADLLWLLHKPRNPEHARIVIDLYFLCEIDEETWLKGVNNYVSRAIQLSLQLKDYDRLDSIKAKLFSAFLFEYSDLKYMNFWIADLMHKMKIDNDFAQDVAESLFNRANTFKVQKDYLKARDYYQLASKKYKKCNLENDWVKSLVEIAETFELEADLRISDSNMVANSFYENAIQAYRDVPLKFRTNYQVEEKIQKLKTKKNLSGQASLDEMVTFETEKYDISPFVESSIAHVARKQSPHQALVYFCGFSGANYQSLKTISKELIGTSTFENIFGKSQMSVDGRIIARIPALNNEVSLDHPENELLLQSKMYQHFTTDVQLKVQGSIIPALRQLSLEHRFTNDLLIAICEQSPLVPDGRAELTGNALWFGFEEEFGTAIHLLCPQLENIVRNELLKVGAHTRNIDKEGIENENGLSTLVTLPEANEVFGEDLLFEIKCIFTESLGFNLRNQVAHGLLDDENSSSIATVYGWWMVLRMIINSLVTGKTK
ncbi:hypothetical protein AC057_11900 [Acinetobacter genomosp. 33YU]|nr:hypothetical protein AC057_11900 [Acinetobacter genomosp. 33YU]